jgi:hypothetical protein
MKKIVLLALTHILALHAVVDQQQINEWAATFAHVADGTESLDAMTNTLATFTPANAQTILQKVSEFNQRSYDALRKYNGCCDEQTDTTIQAFGYAFGATVSALGASFYTPLLLTVSASAGYQCYKKWQRRQQIRNIKITRAYLDEKGFLKL